MTTDDLDHYRRWLDEHGDEPCSHCTTRKDDYKDKINIGTLLYLVPIKRYCSLCTFNARCGQSKILEFVYARMLNVHNENPNADYMIAFETILNDLSDKNSEKESDNYD